MASSSRFLLFNKLLPLQSIKFNRKYIAAGIVIGSSTIFYLNKNTDVIHKYSLTKPIFRTASAESRTKSDVIANQDDIKNDVLPKPRQIGPREERFEAFASITYNGISYMTPQDFLESVTRDGPRYRRSSRAISESEFNSYINQTISKWKASKSLFRNLGERGVISYTEYLFLLCVLTKPESGFKIAFNMFDTDMNEEVDKKEFLVLNKIIGGKLNAGEVVNTESGANVKWTLFKGRTHHKSGKHKCASTLTCAPVEVEKEVQTTTLLTHFFGKHGNDRLNYKEFHKFMENLQTEVLEIEFLEFSKGLPTMSESEFAKILLRNTTLDVAQHDIYIRRIRTSLQREEGITFDEFRKFFLFLNNLDDFTLAMKMHTLADRPISKVDFQQAVKACTGYQLNSHLVETVFCIFDEDGDGHLSYREFVDIMKDRLHRGYTYSRSHVTTRWDAFRHCMVQKLRESE